MTTDRDELEPIEPREAQDMFLDHKATSCAEATVVGHEYRTNHFVRWCDEQGIDNLNDVTGRDLQRYRLWRQEDGDLNSLSLRMQMSSLRVFLKWAQSIEAVPEDLYNKVLVERVGPDQRQRDEMLDADDADELLDYLSTYEYASIEHALLALLWETGIRLGAAHSIDITDINVEEGYVTLEHRPDQGTTLKNGTRGERLVALTAELLELLEEFIEVTRKDVTDAYQREPLFTTSHGRMSTTSLRRTIYRVTAPCYRGEACDGCADGATKCDDAVSPHAVRRGSITHFLSNDVPVQVVSDRMNVSRTVLDDHYDKRSDEVKLEQRRGYLDNI
jgi:site-specific recombinase XerD